MSTKNALISFQILNLWRWRHCKIEDAKPKFQLRYMLKMTSWKERSDTKKKYYLGSSLVLKSPLLLPPLLSKVLLQIHTKLLAINILAGKGSSYAPRKIFFKPALANKKQKKVNHSHKTWKETNKLNESHPSSDKIFNQFFFLNTYDTFLR